MSFDQESERLEFYFFTSGQINSSYSTLRNKIFCNKIKYFLFLAKKTPFNIRFLSDLYENTGAGTMLEATAQPNGFRLKYTQTTC